MSNKPKVLNFGTDTIMSMKAGLDKLANAVKVTLGPRGRNVIIERSWGSPSITKDGVSVAKEVDLKDPFENLGAQMAKDVAAKTGDEAGDGTTTATVLAQAITEEGVKSIITNGSPVELKRGMDKAVQALCAELEAMALPVESKEDIIRVGAISANNERSVGEVLADAIEVVGNDGVITIEESGEAGLTLTTMEGMELSEGYLSKHFNTEQNTSEIALTDPVVIVVNKDLALLNDIVPALNTVVSSSNKPPILLIAKSFSKPVLDALVMNVLKGVVKLVAIKVPGYGDARENVLMDIAVATGAVVFGDESSGGAPLDKVTIDMFGQAGKILISKSRTVIYNPLGDPEKRQERIQAIKNEIQGTKSDYDKEKLLERAAKLSGGIAIVGVGGNSEVEVKELRDRVEDAMHATRAAVESGIVPGGGVALLRARQAALAKGLPEGMSDEQRRGYEIVMKAIEAPIRNIVINAGGKPDVVVDKILSGDAMGYNAHTDTYEDLVLAGVIDPVKVTMTALRNSVSIAGMLLTSSCAITFERVPEPFMLNGGQME